MSVLAMLTKSLKASERLLSLITIPLSLWPLFFVCLFVCLFLFVKLFVFVPTSLDVICEVHRARGSCTNLHYHYHLILLEGGGGGEEENLYLSIRVSSRLAPDG